MTTRPLSPLTMLLSRHTRRRELITLLGGATAWPLGARAQQPARMRRIGMFMNLAADDPQGKLFVEALLQGLQQLGWTDGRNLQVDYRWGAGDAEHYRRYAVELVALAPDVILTTTTAMIRALQEASGTVPIVFVNLVDPVGSGVVASLSRPGGNATGFSSIEYGMSGERLGLVQR